MWKGHLGRKRSSFKCDRNEGHGGKLGRGMLQGKSWEWRRDAFRISRMWTGICKER